MSAFTGIGRQCNAMPDFQDEAFQPDQTVSSHITAAVSILNLEKEELGVLNQEFGFMAESKDKMDRQILVLSMGLKTQEETKLWQDRTSGGLKKE